MKQHEAWLQKSQNDLNAAKILFSAENPVFDTAIYHTQQCGEKVVKEKINQR
jgi:HEPN domain-containing protein